MMLSNKVGSNEKLRNEVINQRTKNQKNLQMKDQKIEKNAEAVIPKEIKEKNQDTFTLSNDMKQFREELEKQIESSKNEKDASMIENNKPKRYKSLYEDEEKQEEEFEEESIEGTEIEEHSGEEIIKESTQEIE